MKQFFLAFFVLLSFSAHLQATTSQPVDVPITVSTANEDFFADPTSPGWLNVLSQAGCGSVNTGGATDATACIQSAFNTVNGSTSASSPTSSTRPIIWFPAGTYNVSSTLLLEANAYISIFGADPATTKLNWTGGTNTTMLRVNGMEYTKINRLTFEGNNTAGLILVDQSWCNASAGTPCLTPNPVNCCADLGNEYADDIFQNAVTAFRCGYLGFQCSEVTFLRDNFTHNTSGISVCNQNALDIWARYSKFANNSVGMTNVEGCSSFGGFDAFNSIFQNNSSADLRIGNPQNFYNFFNNYSTGSTQFLDSGGTGAGANIAIVGNKINTGTNVVQNGGTIGPLVLLGNIIKTSAVPAINLGGDLFSAGNTFTAGTLSSTCAAGAPIQGGSSPSHCHEITSGALTDVINSSLTFPSTPTLPGTPPLNTASIQEVQTSCYTTTCTIPNAITAAVSNNGVVHLQAGTYNISSQITVPANAKIEIIGDGWNTVLSWTGGSNSTLMQCTGPCKTIFRDFQINMNNVSGTTGFLLTNADQTGARVFIEQALLSQSGSIGVANVFVNGTNNVDIEMNGSQILYTCQGPSASGMHIVGGGAWNGGMTNVWTGEGGGNFIRYSISGDPHVLIRSDWNDNATCNSGSNPMQQELNLTGTGTFTFVGSSAFYPQSNTVNDLLLNNFTGTAALVGIDMTEACGTDSGCTPGQGQARVQGTGTGGNVMALGLRSLTTTASPFWTDATTGGTTDTSEFLNADIFDPATAGSTSIAEIFHPSGTSPDPTFVANTLNQLINASPVVPGALAAGVTDARLYHMYLTSGVTGLQINP